jgi:hypothetical protein
MADVERNIQGYSDGVFWERNTLTAQKKHIKQKQNNFTTLELQL